MQNKCPIFWINYIFNVTLHLEMKYNTYTLDNGLRIIHLPSDSQVVYCGYQINAGTRNEEPGEEGLAHFCEHDTFKGTERRKAWHILNCLESVGGDLNAYTNKEGTVYYSAILKEHIARAVDLLSDIVFHSVYPQAEIDKEVEVICDEIESYNDSPAELIYDEFENILFKGSPLGHNILGTAEQVRSFTTEDALRFTRKLYRPDNAIFFAYGDIDFKKLVKLIQKALGECPKSRELACSADYKSAETPTEERIAEKTPTKERITEETPTGETPTEEMEAGDANHKVQSSKFNVQSNHKAQSSKFKVHKRKKEAKTNTNLSDFLLFHLYKREPLYQGSVLIYVNYLFTLNPFSMLESSSKNSASIFSRSSTLAQLWITVL